MKKLLTLDKIVLEIALEDLQEGKLKLVDYNNKILKANAVLENEINAVGREIENVNISISDVRGQLSYENRFYKKTLD